MRAEAISAWIEATDMSDDNVLPTPRPTVLRWPPPDDQDQQVLHGKQGEDWEGVRLTVEWRAGEDVHGTTGDYVRQAGAGGSYRAAPLVRVLRLVGSSAAGADCIVVGRARVRVSASESPPFPTTMTVSLDGAWTRSAADGRWRYRPPDDWAQREERMRLLAALAEPGHDVPQGDADAVSTFIAKGIAEGSRNAMSALREVRYQLEAQLTSGLSPAEPAPQQTETALEVVLVNLIEIRRAISRVRDFAREGVRTVLASHGTNEDLYHAYRAFRDRTRIIADDKRMKEYEMLRLPWIATLDAGVRQCERLDEGLKDEVEVIGGLLSASATIASAHEAQAQDEFNAVAAAVAVGFGLPALILAFYGIEKDPSPFADLRGGLLFIPVVAALLAAMVVGRRSAPSSSRAAHRRLILFCIVAAIALLAGAGAIATWV
jgi:hypothetical protein